MAWLYSPHFPPSAFCLGCGIHIWDIAWHIPKTFLGQDAAKHVRLETFHVSLYFQMCWNKMLSFSNKLAIVFRGKFQERNKKLYLQLLSSMSPMTQTGKCFLCTSLSSNLVKQLGVSFMMAVDSLLILSVTSSSFSLHFSQSSYVTNL